MEAYDLIRVLRTIRRINATYIDLDVRRRVRKSYWSTMLLPSSDKTTNIVGYQFEFCNYGALRYLFAEIFLNQAYRFHTAKRTPFIIDCGANIGMSVFYFKTIYPGARVLAFEPDDDAFSCLDANIGKNNLTVVRALKKAVSATEGMVDFYYDEQSPGDLKMSTIRDRMPKQKKTVHAVRLSTYIDKDEPVDFLKLDVEGAEKDVIEDLNEQGKLDCINQIAIEYHHHIYRDQDNLSEVLRILETAGFGYQIESSFSRPYQAYKFQNILIYAYRKTDENFSQPLGKHTTTMDLRNESA
jgi:FkbM family methyltransferase